MQSLVEREYREFPRRHEVMREFTLPPKYCGHNGPRLSEAPGGRSREKSRLYFCIVFGERMPYFRLARKYLPMTLTDTGSRIKT